LTALSKKVIVSIFLLVAFATTVSAQSSQQLYYNMSNSFEDLSGNSYDGVGNGGITNGGINGQFGAATDFDGTDDYVDIDSVAAVDSQSWTLSLWVKSTQDLNAQYLLDAGGNDLIFAWDADAGDLGYFDADGNFESIAPSPDDGEWHHLAYVLDASDSQGEIFVDSVSQGTANYNSLDISGNVALGSGDSGNRGFYRGGMDEVRLYSEPLTDSQVQALYENNTLGQSSTSASPPEVNLRKPENSLVLSTDTQESFEANVTTYTEFNRLELWTNESEITSFSYNDSSQEKTTIQSGSRWYGRAVLEKLDNGNILGLYRNASSHSNDVVSDKWHIRCSTDEGRTWSQPDHYCNGTEISFFPFDSGLSDTDADIFQAPNGDVVVNFLRMNADGTERRESYQIRSTDNGFTWSGGNVSWSSTGGWNEDEMLLGQDHAICGDTVWISLWMDPGADQGGEYTSGLARSTNNGDSWEFMYNTSGSQNTNEVGVGKLNDNCDKVVFQRATSGGNTFRTFVYGNGTVSDVDEVSSSFGDWERPRLNLFSDGFLRGVGRDAGADATGYWVINSDGEPVLHKEFNPGTGDQGYSDVVEKSNGENLLWTYEGSNSDSDVFQYEFSLDKTTSSVWDKASEKTSGLVNDSLNSINYSFDSAGAFKWNMKAVQSDGQSSFADQNRTVFVDTADTTPPTSSDNWTASGFVDKSEATVELTATDSGSGVEDIYYRVNDGSYSVVQGTSATVTISSQGNNSLEYYAEDSAGNVEATNTEYVALDSNSAPSASFTKTTNDLTVSVDASGSSDSDGSISSYEWDWTNDGTYEGSGETQSHTYGMLLTTTVTRSR